MLRPNPFNRRKSRSAENIKIIIDLIDEPDKPTDVFVSNLHKMRTASTDTISPKTTRKRQQESEYSLATGEGGDERRRKSFDVAVTADSRHSVLGSLMSLITPPAMRKSDQKTGGSLTKGTARLVPGRTSPLVSKKVFLGAQDGGSSQVVTASVSGSSGVSDHSTTPGASSEDLVDNGSDPGTDEVDSGENTVRTKQFMETLQGKIYKTKESIKREQNMKEAIVKEYIQMTAENQPTARIKTLFEKKNQKSAQSIFHLQRKLDSYQKRMTEVETHGYTGHKQAKEMLRDVGQGLNTIVSKPMEFAHLIKNRFGSADNITQLKLDDSATTLEPTLNGKSGLTLLTSSSKYASDDEASSVTSGSGPRATHFSPRHSTAQADATQAMTLTHALLLPLTDELSEVKYTAEKVNDILLRLVEEFEDYKAQAQSEVSLLQTQLEDERFKVQCLEEQLNDLTELHQHEMQNLKQDLTSMEEKIEYRLDERTTDLSDLMDNVSTRISRLEQQQQQQQILSMEMVENATFRTIISKLINVVLAILAVVLVFVSTGANLLSPFVNSTSRLVISLLTVLISWMFYQNYFHMQGAAHTLWTYFVWPWS